jgi:predicted DNA-binding transcriptional regulator AlpA
MKKYLKLKEVCEYLSVSKSFIKNRINIELLEGEHYYRLPNSSLIRFDIHSIDKWIQSNSKTKIINDVLDRLNEN